MPFKTILKNIGGTIKTVTEFVEDEVIDRISNEVKYGVNEFRQGNPAPVLNAMSLGMSGAMAPLTQAVRGVDETEGTLLESAGNYVEDKTGIPSLVTQVAVGTLIPGPGEYKAAGKSIARGVKKAFPLEGVDNIFPPTPPAALATAGAAPRVQLNVEKGGAVMKAVTATNPRVLKPVGVKTGDSMYDKTGAQGKQLLRRDKRILEYKNTISIKNDEMKTLRELKGDPQNLQTFVDNASPELQKYWKSQKGDVNKIIDLLGDNKKNAQEGLSRVESNVLPFDTTKQAARVEDFRNVNYFRSNIGLSEKKLEETSRTIQGYLEQHHLFPKGMSAAFFGKMDDLIEKGVATKDDLILMAEFAAAKGRRAGDIKANLLNMQQTPHNRMHTELRAMGAELNKTDYQRLLKDVDNVDDLLDRWADLFEPGIEGDAVYNAAVAELWEPLDELLMKISPKYTGTSKIQGLE